ncbi:hypothetical protein DL96DRAFT_1643305 [Flagelloscypha sp. PMI_526]|nr:hypothetical protein DL96DRAFT_1643305 [Flagelloscypha sp. PMI_526]
MWKLPLDLYLPVFTHLPRSDLRSCLVVHSAIHRIAEDLLFEHLILRSPAWKHMCISLLEEASAHLFKRIRKLSIELADTRGLSSPALSLDGQHQNTRGEPSSLAWDSLTLEFRDVFIHSVFPFIRSLEAPELSALPLLDILRDCPLLHKLHLSSSVAFLSQEMWEQEENEEEEEETRSIKTIPALASLSDFLGVTSIAAYLREASHLPTSLHLERQFTMDDFDLDLQFLEPFDRLMENLTCLSLGTGVYDKVVTSPPLDTRYEETDLDVLPLESFPRLSTLKLSMNSQNHPLKWGRWSLWVGHCLKDSHPSLQVVAFTGIPLTRDPVNPMKTLNNIAACTTFQIHFIFRGNYSLLRDGIFDAAVSSLQLALPTWNAEEKISFWVQ